jgi:hypothetical protein
MDKKVAIEYTDYIEYHLQELFILFVRYFLVLHFIQFMSQKLF